MANGRFYGNSSNGFSYSPDRSTDVTPPSQQTSSGYKFYNGDDMGRYIGGSRQGGQYGTFRPLSERSQIWSRD